MRTGGKAIAVVALVLSITAGLIGQTAKPAEAFVAPAAPIIIPVVTAGAVHVVNGIQSGRLGDSAQAVVEMASDVLRGFGSAWDYAFSDPEQASDPLPPGTTTTYNGGCWAKRLDVVYADCTSSNRGAVRDDYSGVVTSGNFSGTSQVAMTFLQAVPKGAQSGQITVKVDYSGTQTNNYAQIELRCLNGTSGSGGSFWVPPSFSGSGSYTYTFEAAWCSGSYSGVEGLFAPLVKGDWKAHVGWGGTAVAANSYFWRATRTCAGGGSTVEESAVFREADNPLPIFPDASCVGNALPLSYKVEQVCSVGCTGVKRTVLTWTAPAEWDDPASQTRVQYSDCLPGGSAYPCAVRLLKVTTNGLSECSDPGVDCSMFDPQTATETEWQCRWGPHTVTLTQCRVLVPYLKAPGQTQNGTDMRTPTPSNDPDAEPDAQNSKCVKWPPGWNPIDWILKPVKCALRWAFEPKTTTWESVTQEVQDEVPFVVVTEGAAGLGAMWNGIDGALGGPACLSLDFRGLTPDEYDGGDVQALKVDMPAPSDAGCANSSLIADSSNAAGDLFGFREPIRLAMLVLLLFAAIRKVISGFAPGGDGPQSLDVTP